ncbi:MAG TPA: Zn-dependent alcohol dehydrogenase [Solirubrobacteraceae bacterium]|nr:Zn-dependent alcohol dehydrogenase [Solirubrobacteraceae bacterium]
MSDTVSMRAVVLREPGLPVRVETVLLEPPRRGEVLVRVAAAGVCHSDVHLADGSLGRGRWPMVLGHEGAGVVTAIGADVTGLAPGDHVAFCFVPACGACRACRSGRRNLCEPAGAAALAGTLMDGSSRLRSPDGSIIQHGLMVACFAEHAVVPMAGAVVIPQEVPLWQAALLGCGVVTGIGAVTNAAHVGIGESVCVIGCGGVGLQVIAGARLAGAATIVAVDRDTGKLELARHRGATDVVDATAVDVTSEVRARTGGGVDHAFEVVGASATIRQAWEVLRPGGTAIVVGLAPRGVEVSIPAIDFLSEKTIRGSYYGSADVHEFLPGLVTLLMAGRLDLADVVSDLIELDGIQEAMDRLRRGEGARSVAIVDAELAGASAGTAVRSIDALAAPRTNGGTP